VKEKNSRELKNRNLERQRSGKKKERRRKGDTNHVDLGVSKGES